MKKIFLTFTVICILNIISNAQTPDWLWAKSAGGSSNDRSMSVSTDSMGNIFVAGIFYSPTITFGSYTLANTSSGTYDIFLVKYDSNGNIIWANSAGGVTNDFVYSIATDAIGNVYLTGGFTSPIITFGSFTLYNDSIPFPHMFIVKYDAFGNVIWARDPESGNDRGMSVATDRNGNIFVTGYFSSSTITFGAYTLPNVSTCLRDIFLVKYDPNGYVIWAKSAGGSYVEWARSITVDGTGNIFVTGEFESDTINFDSLSLLNTGCEDIFIVKYDSSGNAKWAKSAIGSTHDYVTSITNDTSDNIFVTGYFGSPLITFDSLVLTNSGDFNTFLVKYNPQGQAIWARNVVGTTSNSAYSVTCDKLGYIYIAGFFYDSFITIGTFNLINTGVSNMYIVKFDTLGNVIWAKCAGGMANDQATTTTTDESNNLVVAGFISSPTVQLGTFSLINNGTYSEDMFIAKLSSVNDIESNKVQNIISLYPNPSQDFIEIETIQQAIIEIINNNGQLIKTIKSNNLTIKIDISDLSIGVYVIKVSTNLGISVYKFIKQ